MDSGGPRAWGCHQERVMRFWSEKDSFSPWAGCMGILGKLNNQGIDIFHFRRMQNDPDNIILLILVVPGLGDAARSAL